MPHSDSHTRGRTHTHTVHTRARIHRADYSAEQHIGAVVVVIRGGGLTPEDGTLTRTMKLRRDAVWAKYGAEVKQLVARLR